MPGGMLLLQIQDPALTWPDRRPGTTLHPLSHSPALGNTGCSPRSTGLHSALQPPAAFLGRSLPQALPGGSAGRESACTAGGLASIPGSGRSPGEGKGRPFQYPGLENSMDCVVHAVAESDATERLSLAVSVCPAGTAAPSPLAPPQL